MSRARDLAAFVSNADGDIKFDTDTLFIDSSDNRVGISTTTVNRKLEVAGNNNGGAKTNYIRITDTDTSATAANQQGGIEFYTSDSGNENVTASIENLYAGSGAGSELTFNTAPNGSSGVSERMRIDENGKIGINHNSPDQKLHVFQSGSQGGGLAPLIKVQNDTNNLTGDGAGIEFHGKYQGGEWGFGKIGGTNAGGNFGGALEFHTNSGTGSVSTGFTKKMTIDHNGYVTKPSTPHMLAMGYKERYGTTDRHLFHTVTTNTGNHWNNTNGKFTCPVAGTYLVTAFSGYKETANFAGIGIGYNGSILSYGWTPDNDSRHGHQNVTIMKNASANDYFYYFAHTSYTTPIAASGNEHHSHFSVYLLG